MSTTIKLRRSALYTPGANTSALSKAFGTAADVLILDLEDAVAPPAKDQARSNVLQALLGSAPAAREVVVRVNGLDSPWCDNDVAALVATAPSAVLFPKISSADDVLRAEATLDRHGAASSIELWCMIETPLAILNAQRIAAAARSRPGKPSRMTTLVLGTNDLLKELRARDTASREALVPSMAIALLAARAHGLVILDGVHNDFKDTAGFAAACTQAVTLGFDGKTLIHPSQIAATNRLFAPDDAEIRQARTVVAAFDLPENTGKGVLQVDGRMVELLHAEIARRTMAIADAIAGSAASGQP